MKSQRNLSDLLHARLTVELLRQSSLEYLHRLDLHRCTQAELAHVQREAQLVERAGKSRAFKLQKQSADDQKAFTSEKERLKSLAVNCVQLLDKCLVEGSSGNLTKVARRFLLL